MDAGHAVNQNYSSIQLWTIKAWLVEQPTACIDRETRHPGAGVLSTWPPEVFSSSSLTGTANIAHVVPAARQWDDKYTLVHYVACIRLRSQFVPFFSVHLFDTDVSLCRVFLRQHVTRIRLTAAEMSTFGMNWLLQTAAHTTSLRFDRRTQQRWRDEAEHCLFKTTPTSK